MVDVAVTGFAFPGFFARALVLAGLADAQATLFTVSLFELRLRHAASVGVELEEVHLVGGVRVAQGPLLDHVVFELLRLALLHARALAVLDDGAGEGERLRPAVEEALGFVEEWGGLREALAFRRGGDVAMRRGGDRH